MQTFSIHTWNNLFIFRLLFIKERKKERKKKGKNNEVKQMTVKCVKQQVKEEGILFLLSSCDDDSKHTFI